MTAPVRGAAPSPAWRLAAPRSRRSSWSAPPASATDRPWSTPAAARTLGYRQLAAGVERVAAGLAARGLAKGDVPAPYSPNLPEFRCFVDVFSCRPFDADVAAAIAATYFGGTPTLRVLHR